MSRRLVATFAIAVDGLYLTEDLAERQRPAWEQVWKHNVIGIGGGKGRRPGAGTIDACDFSARVQHNDGLTARVDPLGVTGH